MIEFLIKSVDDKNDFKFCRLCLNDNKNELVSFLCSICLECLCKGCIDYYKKLIFIMIYDVVFLEEVNKFFYFDLKENFCYKYDFRCLEVFCFDYDILCCVFCSIREYKICKMDLIENVFEKIKYENRS